MIMDIIVFRTEGVNTCDIFSLFQIKIVLDFCRYVAFTMYVPCRHNVYLDLDA
jgi:hypothetical protein